MGESLSQLDKILGDLRDKTGVDAYFVSRGGKETAFTAEWGGEPIHLFVAGKGAEAERSAKLVAYLLAQTQVRELRSDKSDSLKSILLGEGGSFLAFNYLTRYSLADGPCFAVDIMPEKKVHEAAQHFESCVEGTQDMVVKMDDTRLAVVKFLSEGQSSFEFAQFLNQSLYEETGIRAMVGVGCEMKSFGDIAVSYHQAATAVRMSAILHAKGDVHSYREFLLMRLLEDLPRARLKDYMEQFRVSGAEEIFEDEDMAGTAEEFLESSLNISETSRNLFMHRNTLMYRLDKIERATGLNIRKFSDAVTFRVLTILYKLLQP